MQREIVSSRTERSKSWFEQGTGKGTVSCSMGRFHYESSEGSGQFDAEYDFQLQRVNTTRLNGYRITASTWHFEIQTEAPTGPQPPQGSHGYGGKRGQHWVRQRLDEVVFARISDGTRTQIGKVSYDSANIVITNFDRQVGPNKQRFTAGAEVRWNNVLTLGAGNISIVWTVSAKGVRQDVIMDETARAVVDALPQSWAATDTLLGFVVDMDWRDVPTRKMRDVPLGDGSDLWDDGDPMILENAQGEKLGEMRQTFAYAQNRGGTAPMHRRFFRESARDLLVYGLRMDDYANFLPGDLIFDPDISEDVAAEADDGYENQAGTFVDFYSFGGVDRLYAGQYDATYEYDSVYRFTSVDGPVRGDTIDSATITLFRVTGANTVDILVDCDVGANRQDAPSSSHRPDSGWTSGTQVSTTISGAAPNGDKVSGDFASAVQSVIDLAAWASGQNICVAVRSDNNTAGTYIGHHSGGETNPATLDISYTVGAPFLPIFADGQKRRNPLLRR